MKIKQALSKLKSIRQCESFHLSVLFSRAMLIEEFFQFQHNFHQIFKENSFDENGELIRAEKENRYANYIARRKL